MNLSSGSPSPPFNWGFVLLLLLLFLLLFLFGGVIWRGLVGLLLSADIRGSGGGVPRGGGDAHLEAGDDQEGREEADDDVQDDEVGQEVLLEGEPLLQGSLRHKRVDLGDQLPPELQVGVLVRLRGGLGELRLLLLELGQPEGRVGLLGVRLVRGNEHVVEHDASVHGPDFHGNSTDGRHALEWRVVLKVIRVLDLLGRPWPDVVRVVDEWPHPLALVLWVVYERRGPLAAARELLAVWVWHGGGFPLAVLVLIPVLWELRLWISHLLGQILPPVARHRRRLVWNLPRQILVPVIWLDGIRIRDLDLIDPVGWLLVVRVINHLGGKERRLEILEEGALLLNHVVHEHLVGVLLWVEDGSERVRAEVSSGNGRGVLQVLLLVLSGVSVLVAENEVHLSSVAALVWAEHDRIWRLVGQAGRGKGGRGRKKFQVATGTGVAPLELNIVLEDDSAGGGVAEGDGAARDGARDAVPPGLLGERERAFVEVGDAVVGVPFRRNPGVLRGRAVEAVEELRRVQARADAGHAEHDSGAEQERGSRQSARRSEANHAFR
mmetsp:Transcript_5877/g.14284  ORF Transcript_5877/g.14284 Transcript_5877/m.14284 type:complete len:550 (+) Transcript_5877:149-1798(+)